MAGTSKQIVVFGLLSLAVSLVLPGCGSGTAPADPHALKINTPAEELIRELEVGIPALMDKAGVPGLQIAVIRNGRILWHKGFGVKNTQTDGPVDGRTVFEAASLTKPFFAYLAMKMVAAGELDLDRPLVEYTPREYLEETYIRHSMELEGFNQEWFRRITARQVLSHSSGLPHGGPRRPLPILFEPGSRYRYSADGYMYLQRVIEHLKGRPLHEIMREELIEPLGMTDSSMVWQDRYEEQAAVGHDMFSGTSGSHRKRRSAHAAASLYTTACDYAKFVAAVLNEEGLSLDHTAEMLSPQIDVSQRVFWSLGFGLEDNDAGRAFWQWGDYGIFRNFICAFKDHGIGVVYLTNSFNGLSLGPELLTLAIGGGENLALAHLGYPPYDAPAIRLGRVLVDQGLEEGRKLYLALRGGSPETISEQDLNSLGYSLLQAGKPDEAIAVFQWNTSAHPRSANTYDSLAEAYLRRGDVDKAIEYYGKTLEAIPLDPSPDKGALRSLDEGARNQLNRLKKR